MTDQDSVLWQQAQKDYYIALRGAIKAWTDVDLHEQLPEDSALQAAAATIMLHHKYLVEQERIHARVPPSAAPAAVTGDSKGVASAGAVPPCPSCGGPMEDKRDSKRSDKAPDFVCLQSVRPCGKPSKDGKYFNKTGRWIEPANGTPKPKAQGAVAGVAAGRNFAEMPETLAPEDDELPF